MKDKILPYLQLMRFANIFTAMADVLAGYLIVSGMRMRFPDLAGLLLSSSCIYAGGCVLNDFCDKETDARERPFRPLPAGKISSREALILLLILLGLGLAASLWVGYSSALVAGSLVTLVFSYNMGTKDRTHLGALNMGACRALNLVLGMSRGPFPMEIWPLFPIVSLVHVFSLTLLSRFEVNDGLGNTKWSVAAGWAGVVLTLGAVTAGGGLSMGASAFLWIFTIWTGLPLLKALMNPGPEVVGKAVKALILGIPLLDAIYVSGMQGWAFGIPVVLCLVPAVFVSRYLYVT